MLQRARDKLGLQGNREHHQLIFIAWFEFYHSPTIIKDDVVSRECFPSFSTVSTAGVTRAGAGGGTPSNWKNAEA
jgi:hypothetical protein